MCLAGLFVFCVSLLSTVHSVQCTVHTYLYIIHHTHNRKCICTRSIILIDHVNKRTYLQYFYIFYFINANMYNVHERRLSWKHNDGNIRGSTLAVARVNTFVIRVLFYRKCKQTDVRGAVMSTTIQQRWVFFFGLWKQKKTWHRNDYTQAFHICIMFELLFYMCCFWLLVMADKPHFSIKSIFYGFKIISLIHFSLTVRGYVCVCMCAFYCLFLYILWKIQYLTI